MRLDELLIKGDEDNIEIFAYKENLWKLSNEDVENESDEFLEILEIINKLNSKIEKYYPIEEVSVDDFTDLYELSIYITENDHIPFVIGRIEGNSLVIDELSTNYPIDSATSLTLKKVMKELGLDKIKTTSIQYIKDSVHEFDIEILRNEFIKPLSEKTFYHGTDLSSLEKILSKGIMATGETRFDTIVHRDKVFITTRLGKSLFHAFNSARVKNSHPVVIALKVPDVNKLILDYDVAIDIYGLESEPTQEYEYDSVFYDAGASPDFKTIINHNIPENDVEYTKDKTGLNTELGIFGYKGRIPSSHIKFVLLSLDDLRNHIMFEEEYADVDPSNLNSETMAKLSPSEYKNFKENYLEEFQEELENLEDDD